MPAEPFPATPAEIRAASNTPWEAGGTDSKAVRIEFLIRKRIATKADLLLKFQDEDYHGVADAAMDLRDIDSELKGLRL